MCAEHGLHSLYAVISNGGLGLPHSDLADPAIGCLPQVQGPQLAARQAQPHCLQTDLADPANGCLPPVQGPQLAARQAQPHCRLLKARGPGLPCSLAPNPDPDPKLTLTLAAHQAQLAPKGPQSQTPWLLTLTPTLDYP